MSLFKTKIQRSVNYWSDKYLQKLLKCKLKGTISKIKDCYFCTYNASFKIDLITKWCVHLSFNTKNLMDLTDNETVESLIKNYDIKKCTLSKKSYVNDNYNYAKYSIYYYIEKSNNYTNRNNYGEVLYKLDGLEYKIICTQLLYT